MESPSGNTVNDIHDTLQAQQSEVKGGCQPDFRTKLGPDLTDGSPYTINLHVSLRPWEGSMNLIKSKILGSMNLIKIKNRPPEVGESARAMAATARQKRLYLHHQGEFQNENCTLGSLHDSDHDLRAIKGWDQQFGCYIWAEFRSTFQGVKMCLKLFITIVCSSTLYVYSDVTFSPAHPISWLHQPRLLPILMH